MPHPGRFSFDYVRLGVSYMGHFEYYTFFHVTVLSYTLTAAKQSTMANIYWSVSLFLEHNTFFGTTTSIMSCWLGKCHSQSASRWRSLGALQTGTTGLMNYKCELIVHFEWFQLIYCVAVWSCRKVLILTLGRRLIQCLAMLISLRFFSIWSPPSEALQEPCHRPSDS